MFTNAVVLTNASGIITGSNVGASTENGELLLSGWHYASVWYSWTAPSDGLCTFQTTDNLAQGGLSQLDTTLAIYTGTAISNLTQVAFNDDINLSAGNLASRVFLQAKAGQTYYICVDGYNSNQGTFALKWSSGNTRDAGTFRFASSRTNSNFGARTFYLAGQDDWMGPAYVPCAIEALGPRMTVTRVDGYSGRVLVDYAITNLFYTNVYETNVCLTNTLSNGQLTVSGAAYVRETLQNNNHGIITPIVNRTMFTISVRNPANVTNDYTTNFIGADLTQFADTEVCWTNAPRNTAGQNLGTPDGNGNVVNVFWTGWVPGTTVQTNITLDTVSGTSLTNIVTNAFTLVPSAIPNVDYIPMTNTLVFDDFEMSKDIFPYIYGWSQPGLNGTIICTLTNARLAPLESFDTNSPVVISDIRPPIVDPLDGRATMNILDKAAPPSASVCDAPLPVLNFECSSFRINPRDGNARIYVQRTGLTTGDCRIDYRIDWTGINNNYNYFPQEAGSDYALRGEDFTIVSGTLNWGDGDTKDKAIDIPIKFVEGVVKFDRDLQICLVKTDKKDKVAIGNISTANLTIIYDYDFGGPQSAGSVDRTYNPDSGNFLRSYWNYGIGMSDPPGNFNPGANRSVYAVAVQANGSSVIGGAFSSYNGYPFNHIARVLPSGFADLSFDPANGADDSINAIVIDGNSKILIAGNFTSYNGIGRYHIARLNSNGSLDMTFNPGSGVTSLDGNAVVESMALQNDGKIIIVGTFDTFNGTTCRNIARLMPNGSVDTNFDATLGTHGSIYSVFVEANGNILVGGSFDAAGGLPRSCIARFDSTGKVDPAFSIGGSGINGAIYAIASQPGSGIVVGGAFTLINGAPNNHIARLLPADGQVDPSFQCGSGADAEVYAITPQPDGTLLLGGMFTTINQTRRVGIARILSYGAVDTSFMDTAYNQFAGLINHYGNPNADDPTDIPGEYNSRNSVYAIALENSGNVLIGGSFARVGGGLTRYDIRNRANYARLVGGSTRGPGNIEMMSTSYSANENAGRTFISLNRTNGSLGPISVTLTTNLLSGSGAIKPGDIILDPLYSAPTWPAGWGLGGGWWNGATAPHIDYGWMVSDGSYGPNYATIPYGYSSALVYITLIDNNVLDGNRKALLSLLSPKGTDILFLGGVNVPTAPALGRSQATFQIIDDDFNAGVFSFSSPTYAVDENGAFATLTVLRKQGTTGNVSVNWSTVNGTNAANLLGATNFVHFKASATNTLTFKEGDTQQTLSIPIMDDTAAQLDRYFTVKLSDPTVRSSIDTNGSSAVVTIVDNDIKPGHLDFAVTNFVVSELSTSAVVTVYRRGGSTGKLSVQCSASAGTAINGVNFVATTNTLVWDSGITTPRTMLVPINHDNAVTGDLTVNLRLFNPIVSDVTNNPDNTNILAYGHGGPAKLTIVDQDSYGKFSLNSSSYSVMANSGSANITVVRKYGSSDYVTIGYSTVNGTAVSPTNYQGLTNTLVFNPGELAKVVSIPVLSNSFTGVSNLTFNVVLSDPSTNNLLIPPTGGALITNATVAIVDDKSWNEPAGSVDPQFLVGDGFNDNVLAVAKQRDGKILAGGDFTFINKQSRNRIARLNTDGTVDNSFQFGFAGANDTVRSILVVQSLDSFGISSDLTVIGGSFTNVNGINQGHLARLYEDGRLDETFQIGAGADSTVYAMAQSLTETSMTSGTNTILIVGSFLKYNGIVRNGIARLNMNGSLDTSFDPGIGGGGTNATIYAVAVQADGKILVGGNFTTFDSVSHPRIARLNVDGSIDSGFNASLNDTVRAIVVQPDGKILVGGSFTNANGDLCNHIGRLNLDGSTDYSFKVGLGANDSVLAIQLDPSGRIVVGGNFTRASGVTRYRLTQLNPDGTVDAGINFGAGADDFVSSIVIQDNGNIVVGGGFTTFDRILTPRLARLFGGTMLGSGKLEFDFAFYTVSEADGNALISMRRIGATYSTISGDVVTSDGTAANGIDYIGITNRVVLGQGETFQTISVSVIDNFKLDNDRTVNLALQNYSPQDAYGPQPTATLTIQDDECLVSFLASENRVTENDPLGAARIRLIRSGNISKPASVDVIILPGGSAQPGVRYLPFVTNTVTFASGETNQFVNVTNVNDSIYIGDQTVILGLTNSVGAIIGNPSASTLTIVEDDLTASGNLCFLNSNMLVPETSGSVVLTVLRTNGISGPISVQYTTVDATATNGFQYIGTNATLSFADGEVRKDIAIQIKNDHQALGSTYFKVVLSNPQGTAILGTNTAIVNIQEADTGVSFQSDFTPADEAAGTVTIPVQRVGGSAGEFTVRVTSADDTAKVGTNYMAVDTTLHFASGEMRKTFPVQILRDYKVVAGLSFHLQMAVVPVAGSIPVQVVSPTVNTVMINDADSGYSFTTNAFEVTETGTSNVANAVITVIRSGSCSQIGGVYFATQNGTALAGTNHNYIATSGLLPFAVNQVSNSFLVPIVSDFTVKGDLTVLLSLSNVVNGQLLAPTNAVLTIHDADTSIGFSSSGYSVSKCDVSVNIDVVRKGALNQTNSVVFGTSDSTSSAGHYQPTNGILEFKPGETTKSFTVQVNDDSQITGDATVHLTLSDFGNGAMPDVSVALLTITECHGTFVRSSGQVLTYESITPKNGVIDVGETVTIWLGLRSLSADTTNLWVTLLATNGITNPIGQSGNSSRYGALIKHGHTVSMPFTFTAVGANGQDITAMLKLEDRLPTSTNYNFNPVLFNFTIGASTTSLSNTAPITIVDATPTANSKASPYPSIITVPDTINGNLSGLTVTLMGVKHQNTKDVSVLLVKTNNGVPIKVILMSHCGTNNLASANLTFDDRASTLLPQNGSIVTSTNKPSAYGLFNNIFPSPAPAGPYGTNLSVFNGSKASGEWYLYVVDDAYIDSGFITNGWSISYNLGTPVPSYADLGLTMIPSADKCIVSNTLTYTVTITNYGPAAATNVVMTNIMPAFAQMVQGPLTSNTNGTFIYTGPVLPMPELIGSNFKYYGTSFAVTIMPTVPTPDSTFATNTMALSGLNDLNFENNLASHLFTAVALSADLEATITATPNSAYPGDFVTYNVTVLNHGPSKATGNTLQDLIPSAFSFVSCSCPSTFTNNLLTVTLGDLDVNQQLSVTIVVKVNAMAPGEYENRVSVDSPLESFKDNNKPAAKIQINGVPPISIVGGSRSLNLSWPVGGSYKLVMATNLTNPVWVDVTNPAPAANNGQYSVSITTSNSSRFYKLLPSN